MNGSESGVADQTPKPPCSFCRERSASIWPRARRVLLLSADSRFATREEGTVDHFDGDKPRHGGADDLFAAIIVVVDQPVVSPADTTTGTVETAALRWHRRRRDGADRRSTGLFPDRHGRHRVACGRPRPAAPRHRCAAPPICRHRPAANSRLPEPSTPVASTRKVATPSCIGASDSFCIARAHHLQLRAGLERDGDRHRPLAHAGDIVGDTHADLGFVARRQRGRRIGESTKSPRTVVAPS